MAFTPSPLDNNAPPMLAPPPPSPVSAPSAPTVDDSASTTQPAPVIPPPVPAPVPNQNVDATAHQSRIGKIFQDIAGGQTTDYAQTPNGPVPVKRNLKPGELARNILGSALSLMAAGAGGDLAARQKRPFQMNPNETVGAVIHGPEQQRQQQAQKVFENQQTADAATLRAAQNAREQQKSIQDTSLFTQQSQLNDQRLASGDREAIKDQQDIDDKFDKQYYDDINMPGAEITKGVDGKELNFYDTGNKADGNFKSAGQNAQDYVTAHPDVLHGRTKLGDPASKYNVTYRRNPVTHAFQIIDFPADRHDKVIEYYHAKKDKKGNPILGKDGQPQPDGTYAPNGVPTYLTDTVSPNDARKIDQDNETHKLQVQNLQSEIADRNEQTAERKATLAKAPEAAEADDLFQSGKFDKMLPDQILIEKGVIRSDLQNAYKFQQAAEKDYNDYIKANQLEDDPDKAQKSDEYQAYQEARDEVNTTLAKWHQLNNGAIRGGTVGTDSATGGSDQGPPVKTDPNLGPEAAVNQLRQQRADAATVAANAATRQSDLDTLKTLTTKGPGHPAYNGDLDTLIKDHPNWTDDEKIRAMKQLAPQQLGEDANSAVSASLPKPPQPGSVIDPDTAKAYFQASGSDPAKARQMATQAGWKVQ